METTRDLMSPNPVVVAPDTPLGTCAARMLDHGIRHLPVVDGKGRATHLLTDVAVFRHGGLAGGELELWMPFAGADGPLVAEQVQVPARVCVHPDDPLPRTLRALLAGSQDSALVLDEDHRLVGILTEHDGVALAVQVLEDSPLTVEGEASAPVATVGRDTSAIAAFELMERGGIRHLPVVDDEGLLIGVLSMGDLLSDQVPRQRTLVVGDVLRPRPAISGVDGIRLAEAAGRMLTAKIGCLPIVNDVGEPRRIVSRTDLIEAALSGLEERAVFSAPDE